MVSGSNSISHSRLEQQLLFASSLWHFKWRSSFEIFFSVYDVAESDRRHDIMQKHFVKRKKLLFSLCRRVKAYGNVLKCSVESLQMVENKNHLKVLKNPPTALLLQTVIVAAANSQLPGYDKIIIFRINRINHNNATQEIQNHVGRLGFFNGN